jgi:hypothetical protein
MTHSVLNNLTGLPVTRPPRQGEPVSDLYRASVMCGTVAARIQGAVAW